MSTCESCGKPCGEDYEYCYSCNEDRGSELVKVTVVEVIIERELSYRLRIEGVEDQWYPKSECELQDDVLYIPRWLAEKKEVDYVE